MEKLNNLLERMASPFKAYANYLLRIGLGLSFFLHGYGKVPIIEGFKGWLSSQGEPLANVFLPSQDFVGWLSSKGVPLANVVSPMVAWGEMLAGVGILFGGLIGLKAPSTGNVITRLSGGAIGVIMIGALLIAHSNWSLFTGERDSVLFASEQLFLLLLGIYFAIKGNNN